MRSLDNVVGRLTTTTPTFPACGRDARRTDVTRPFPTGLRAYLPVTGCFARPGSPFLVRGVVLWRVTLERRVPICVRTRTTVGQR